MYNNGCIRSYASITRGDTFIHNGSLYAVYAPNNLNTKRCKKRKEKENNGEKDREREREGGSMKQKSVDRQIAARIDRRKCKRTDGSRYVIIGD